MVDAVTVSGLRAALDAACRTAAANAIREGRGERRDTVVVDRVGRVSVVTTERAVGGFYDGRDAWNAGTAADTDVELACAFGTTTRLPVSEGRLVEAVDDLASLWVRTHPPDH
jgi:hypothetical protein